MEVTSTPPRLLLAEADVATRRLLADHLRGDGFAVDEVGSGIELLERLRIFGGEESCIADLIITDDRMPGLSGIETLRTLRVFDRTTPAILITESPDEGTVAAAAQLDAALFDTPLDLDDLRTAAYLMTWRARRCSIEH